MDDEKSRMQGGRFAINLLSSPKTWRNVVDLRHLPEGTHCLANRPGSLVRWTFHNSEIKFETSHSDFADYWANGPFHTSMGQTPHVHDTTE
ncbi:MAG TPA: hypothetical protein VGJ73_12845 [Verrucomicrobiae bacterium]